MASQHYDMIHIHELWDYPETEAFSFGRTPHYFSDPYALCLRAICELYQGAHHFWLDIFFLRGNSTKDGNQ